MRAVNRFLCSIPSLMLAMVLVGPASAADYVHMSSSRTISIRSDQHLIAIGDVAHEATFCDPATGLICFQSRDFKFAVPVDVGKRSTWAHDGVSYSSRRLDETLLGRPGPYWLIKQQGHDRFEFVYSDRFGLLSIQTKSRATGAYILMQSCRFAAAADWQ